MIRLSEYQRKNQNIQPTNGEPFFHEGQYILIFMM